MMGLQICVFGLGPQPWPHVQQPSPGLGPLRRNPVYHWGNLTVDIAYRPVTYLPGGRFRIG
ncbi:hypothetical protein [Azospirillum largimobile]